MKKTPFCVILGHLFKGQTSYTLIYIAPPSRSRSLLLKQNLSRQEKRISRIRGLRLSHKDDCVGMVMEALGGEVKEPRPL